MNEQEKPANTNGRRRMAMLAAVVVLALAAIVVRKTGPGKDENLAPTFAARQGPLTISVSQAGTIRPKEQVILKNEVEGQTTILFLVTEGKTVAKGDLLVELDASKLVDQKVNQQIQVINTEAAFVNARENLEVVRNQAGADVDQAELSLEFASQDLAQYTDGEYPKLEKEAKAKITLAEETLTNAANSREWSQKLFEEKYLAESELKKDELSWRKAGLDLELARDELHLLQDFTRKRRLAELKSDLKQKELALERIKRKAAADVSQAEAKLKAGEAEYQQQRDKLGKIEEQIKKTRIFAPMNGTVIYATSTKSSLFSKEEPLAEGQAVRERQELIYLPTTASFNVEVKIHEASLQKISLGLLARITVDALPGREFTGRVSSLAPLPDATSIFMNPDLKVYNAVIQIDGNGAEMRNGMSCRAEIIVEQYDDALYVPVQSVLMIGGQPTAFVLAEGKTVARPVSIGLDNNSMVRVLDGLAAGEEVLLAPPLAAAGASDAGGNGRREGRPNGGQGKKRNSQPETEPAPGQAQKKSPGEK